MVARHLFSKLGFTPSDFVSVCLLDSDAMLVVTEYFLQRCDVVRPRCFLASTKLILPVISGLLFSSQPLLAVVLSSLFLGVTFAL